ncbi:MAG: sporulation integral membrane protein YtvI [Clostridia bacterium]|nr:sporulation integral membrane protein YtvI [Clostridia bacterium]
MDEYALRRKTQTEKRWTFVVNCLFFGIIIGLFYFFANPAMGVLFPVFFALFLGVVLQRPVNFLTKKTKLPRKLWAVLLVLLITSAVVLLLVFVGLRIYEEFKSFFEYIREATEDFDIKAWLAGLSEKLSDALPGKLSETVMPYIEDFISDFGSSDAESGGSKGISSALTGLLSSLPSSVFSKAKQIPTMLISAVVSIVLACFFTIDYNSLKDSLFARLPLKTGRRLKDTKRVLFTTMKKMLRAYALITLITATEVYIILTVLRLAKVFDSNYIFVISVITAIVDIVPVLGTGTVFIPWAVYSLFTGRIGLGIGLLIGYAAITVIRQVIEPKLVAGQVGLSPVITICSMYIGGRVLGALGIFILPLTVMFIKLLSDEGIIEIFATREAKNDSLTEETESIGDTKQDKPE